MLNSCRHRGLQVCGPSGQAAQLTCGYHGWVYDLDGRLVGVTGGDEQFSQWARDRDLGLVPVTRTDEIGHLLFCSWDAEWAPVADDEQAGPSRPPFTRSARASHCYGIPNRRREWT